MPADLPAAVLWDLDGTLVAILDGVRALRVSGARVLLSDRDILAEIDGGRITLDPWDEAMMQPSSIDVRLDRYFRVFDNHKYPSIDPAADQSDLTRVVETAEAIAEGQPGVGRSPRGLGTRRLGFPALAGGRLWVRGLLDEVFGRAVSILRRNRDILDTGAAELLARETMSHDDLEHLAAGLKREEAGKLEIAAIQGER